MRRRKIDYLVSVPILGGARTTKRTKAATPGAAARQVFAYLLAGRILKRQPATTSDGGFEGVTIRPAHGR